MACTATSASRLKSSARLATSHCGLGAVGDDRVHRIRRHESDRASARPAERLQQLLQDLVGAVGGPEVLDADSGVPVCAARYAARSVRSATASRSGYRCRSPATAWTEAVTSSTSACVGGCGFSLVLSRTGTSQLRCAVRRFAAQVLAERQIVERHLLAGRHLSNLRRTASPCAGRFSASDSVMTYPDTSFSAASS